MNVVAKVNPWEYQCLSFLAFFAYEDIGKKPEDEMGWRNTAECLGTEDELTLLVQKGFAEARPGQFRLTQSGLDKLTELQS